MKHRKHLKCWKRLILMFYEKVGTGQQKAGKVKKKQLENDAASNQVNWQEVRNMTGYKKSFSEMKPADLQQTASTNRQAISQHDKFLHIKLPKPLDISSSTVQNITNKFRESEGISVHRALSATWDPCFEHSDSTNSTLSWKSLHGLRSTAKMYCLWRRRGSIGLHIRPLPESLYLWSFGDVCTESAACTCGKAKVSVEKRMQVLEQAVQMYFSGKAQHILARRCQTAYCIYYDSVNL